MHVGSGDAKKVWHLPGKLLKSNSTFFTAALDGGFAEGISKSITLVEEDPEIFQWFVVWLYGGFDPILEIYYETPDFFVPLWALGDRLGCPLIQDDVMRSLMKFHDGYIEEVTLKQIYEESMAGSRLRRWAVDQCLRDIRVHPAPADGDEWSYSRFAKDNEDFAQQLAEATILLGDVDPYTHLYDKSRHLFAPWTCPSGTKSGS